MAKTQTPIQRLLKNADVYCRSFFPYTPTIKITDDMRAKAKQICDRIDKKAKERGLKHIFEVSTKRRVAGWLGQLVFYEHVYHDWKRALEHITIGESDKYDFKIDDLTVNIKTTEPSYVVEYSENFGLQIPITQLGKYDAYVDIVIAESEAHILGFILDSELNKYPVRRNIKSPAKVVDRAFLHPIKDLFAKPIRTDRTIAKMLPKEMLRMYEGLKQFLLTFSQIKRLMPIS